MFQVLNQQKTPKKNLFGGVDSTSVEQLAHHNLLGYLYSVACCFFVLARLLSAMQKWVWCLFV